MLQYDNPGIISHNYNSLIHLIYLEFCQDRKFELEHNMDN